jgi:hypothetical protein
MFTSKTLAGVGTGEDRCVSSHIESIQ